MLTFYTIAAGLWGQLTFFVFVSEVLIRGTIIIGISQNYTVLEKTNILEKETFLLSELWLVSICFSWYGNVPRKVGRTSTFSLGLCLFWPNVVLKGFLSPGKLWVCTSFAGKSILLFQRRLQRGGGHKITVHGKLWRREWRLHVDPPSGRMPMSWAQLWLLCTATFMCGCVSSESINFLQSLSVQLAAEKLIKLWELPMLF